MWKKIIINNIELATYDSDKVLDVILEIANYYNNLQNDILEKKKL